MHERDKGMLRGRHQSNRRWRIQFVCAVESIFNQASLLIDKIRYPCSQCLRDASQAQDRHVSLATFDAADEGPVQTASFAKLSLGQIAIRPQISDAVADVSQKCLVAEVHG